MFSLKCTKGSYISKHKQNLARFVYPTHPTLTAYFVPSPTKEKQTLTKNNNFVSVKYFIFSLIKSIQIINYRNKLKPSSYNRVKLIKKLVLGVRISLKQLFSNITNVFMPRTFI